MTRARTLLHGIDSVARINLQGRVTLAPVVFGAGLGPGRTACMGSAK